MLYHYQVLKSDDGGVTNRTVYESDRISKLAGDSQTIWIYLDHSPLPQVIFGPGEWTSVHRVPVAKNETTPEVTD